MNISYRIIKSIFPHFNILCLTAEDFWREAKRRKIIVIQKPLLVDGYYERKGGKDYIVLNSQLQGLKWLHTAFHELFHAILDVPPGKMDIRLNRSKIQIKNKQELIADALALMAIIPMTELEQLTTADLEHDPELAQAVRDRIVVRAEYRK